MKSLIILLLLSIQFAEAFDPYETKASQYNPICNDSYLELDHLPAVRDQGQFGLCYAHSTLLLLEYLRCAHSSSPESCYAEKGSVLHLARFNNTASEDKIKIGGNTSSILSRFENDRNLAKESCANYETWKKLDELHRKEIANMPMPSEFRSQADYFYYLKQKTGLNGKTTDRECLVQEILDSGVKQNYFDLMNILKNSIVEDVDSLRYDILVPKQCFDDEITYPDYDTIIYPEYGKKKTYKGIRDQVHRSLKAGYPIEVSFCSSKNANGECLYHSTTIVGERTVCSLDKCEQQFRLQNSYGQRWQEYHDNGWIDAKNFSDQIEDIQGLITILPKGQKLDTSLSAPYFTDSPIDSDAREVRMSSEGKVANYPAENCWKVNPQSVNYVKGEDAVTPPPRVVIPQVYNNRPVPPINRPPGKNIMYMCTDSNGSTAFSDHPMPGMTCRERKL